MPGLVRFYCQWVHLPKTVRKILLVLRDAGGKGIVGLCSCTDPFHRPTCPFFSGAGGLPETSVWEQLMTLAAASAALEFGAGLIFYSVVGVSSHAHVYKWCYLYLRPLKAYLVISLKHWTVETYFTPNIKYILMCLIQPFLFLRESRLSIVVHLGRKNWKFPLTMIPCASADFRSGCINTVTKLKRAPCQSLQCCKKYTKVYTYLMYIGSGKPIYIR